MYDPQAKVVAAQAAVESYRSGCDPEPELEPDDDTAPSTGNPEKRDGSASSSMAPEEGEGEGGAHDGEEEENGERGVKDRGAGGAVAVELRRKEEVAALSSHLQVIVMHLVRRFCNQEGGGEGGGEWSVSMIG